MPIIVNLDVMLARRKMRSKVCRRFRLRLEFETLGTLGDRDRSPLFR
jgi:hypothetical protein